MNDSCYVSDVTHLANIRKAMALISEKTCITYEEKPYNEVLSYPHMEIIFEDSTCLSFIGTIDFREDDGTYTAQPLYLSLNCFDVSKY